MLMKMHVRGIREPDGVFHKCFLFLFVLRGKKKWNQSADQGFRSVIADVFTRGSGSKQLPKLQRIALSCFFRLNVNHDEFFSLFPTCSFLAFTLLSFFFLTTVQMEIKCLIHCESLPPRAAPSELHEQHAVEALFIDERYDNSRFAHNTHIILL